MHKVVKRLIALVIGVLGLTSCATFESAFDYAGGNGNTAVVVFPEPIRLLGLDGRKAGLPLLLKYPYIVTLGEGPHIMSFQYGETWGVGDANELVRGPIMELSFEVESGAQYQLDFDRPESVKNRDEAEAYINSFRAWVIDDKGRRTEALATGRFGGLGERILGTTGD